MFIKSKIRRRKENDIELLFSQCSGLTLLHLLYYEPYQQRTSYTTFLWPIIIINFCLIRDCRSFIYCLMFQNIPSVCTLYNFYLFLLHFTISDTTLLFLFYLPFSVFLFLFFHLFSVDALKLFLEGDYRSKRKGLKVLHSLSWLPARRDTHKHSGGQILVGSDSVLG